MLIRIAAYTISGLLIWNFSQISSSTFWPLHTHLALDIKHAMVFGVCSGISTYTGLDVSLVRMVFAASCLYKGIGIAFYLLGFLIMPAS